MRRRASLASILALLLMLPASAEATFPGPNGVIAYDRTPLSSHTDIYRIAGDGSLNAPILAEPTIDEDPAWSPDRRTIAFSRDAGGNRDIYTARYDGTDVRRVTTNAAADRAPAWAPDGQRIVFASARPADGLFVINADGSGEAPLPDQAGNAVAGSSPDWSPDGQTIAFGAGGRIWKIPASGGTPTQVTGLGGEPCCQFSPSWSPDGQQITYAGGSGGVPGIHAINADGSNNRRLTTSGSAPSWSPDGRLIAFAFSDCGVSNCTFELRVTNPLGTGSGAILSGFGQVRFGAPGWGSFRPEEVGYPRPRGASPLRLPLVPAYDFCDAPNNTHGAPLAFGSCSPPVHMSSSLTFGTPDANGAPVNSTGEIVMKAVVGDALLAASLSDVRCKVAMASCTAGALSDYTGTLIGQMLNVRITDHEGAPSTIQDRFFFQFSIPCAPTSATDQGSDCSVATTLNTLLPGAVVDGNRSIWAPSAFAIIEGTPSEGTLAVPGIFIP